MTQNNQDVQGDENYYRNMKIIFIIGVMVSIYFWLFGAVSSSQHFGAKLNCGLMEEYVEVYGMDEICNESFKDNKINRLEYWSIISKFKAINEIWHENIANGKGTPALVINAKEPIEKRFFNVENYMEVPGLVEIVSKRDDLNNKDIGSKNDDAGGN